MFRTVDLDGPIPVLVQGHTLVEEEACGLPVELGEDIEGGQA